jgi:protein-tyrosine phosphatase
LLEPPFAAAPYGLDTMLLGLMHEGHQIVLAHPERCSAFRSRPDMLASVVEAGALTSVTAGALVGRFGEQTRRFALALAREGMLHNVASDAHDIVRRPPSIAAEIELAGLAPLAEWLTEGVPRAILTGEQIPERPAVDLPSIRSPHRRSLWGRR